MIVQSGCQVFEYSWEARGHRPSNSTETVVSVSFDYGAQQQFSGVCVIIGHKDDVSAERIGNEWGSNQAEQLISENCTRAIPSIHCIINWTAGSVPRETEIVGRSASSLPTLDINFEIESIRCVPDTWDVVLNCQNLIDGEFKSPPTGGLTFKDSRDPSCPTWLEINHPLTADTQSVVVSFTSSPFLYTPGRRGSHPPPDRSLAPDLPNFSESSDVNSQWRKDLLACALVCKQWTCALDLLLKDFHSTGGARATGYPPEICSFANTLTLRPNLAVSITCLSPDYFFRHVLWRSLSYTLDASESPFLPRQSRPPSERARIECFVGSLLTILRLAKNLRSLSLPFRWNIDLPNDYLDALRGLDKIEEVDVTGGFNAVHRGYLATWSSLKRLSMSISEPTRRNDPVPTTPPRYSLTNATLWSGCRDEYLTYILSSSSSSLERLMIAFPDHLTHSGLRSALHGVSKCLVVLHVGMGGSAPVKLDDEEYALDSVIVEMARLEYLAITPPYATHCMIERRAEAFKKSHASGSPAALPVTRLLIDAATHIPRHLEKSRLRLLTAARQVWPGWEIEVIEP
ncbi:hypothetical protein JVU11DRAFT_7526 [Chiua virens]|nr:hypothetical protein JVU11DRAFT_7526 [Chiua virens]